MPPHAIDTIELNSKTHGALTQLAVPRMKRWPATRATLVFQIAVGRWSATSERPLTPAHLMQSLTQGQMQMTDFTPYSALAGGVLIGLAASVLLIGYGRIAGISGIAGNLLLGKPGDRAWRAAFLVGLLLAGLVGAGLLPEASTASPRPLAAFAGAGLLVGIGTRLGSGCTSGHGVCGLSRLSPRSLVATLSFIVSGAVMVAVLRWIGGGA